MTEHAGWADAGQLLLPPSEGERLTTDAYRREFRAVQAGLRHQQSWKFERAQEFEDEGDSWRSFRAGRWEDALRQHQECFADLAEETAQDRERGTPFHRVRVVEKPLTPYLQWELHSFRVQAAAGNHIRVVAAEALGDLETAGALPEVVVLGDRALYQVAYDDRGALDGATRFTSTATVARWGGFIRDLYHSGEDVLSFFDREVAHLPPPNTSAR
ncbi:DUF6879 family protein [Streptomyces sp. SM14]|uniref:DUF6879 family protein n=1 Tax=Streptomyces sp. SM14 TaxID=1736045 RepID=UPI000CD4C458|nr:DUF6879 family protein [Streptomyces sp. SM14]